MENNDDLIQFASKYWKRFDYFRSIEAQEITKGRFSYDDQAFALLSDIEACYASKAYYACLILAHSIIETHLRKVEGMSGKIHNILKNAGLYGEISWLTNFRNDIAHGNRNDLIQYAVYDELEQKLEYMCITAFRFMHELPIRLQQLNDNG